MLQWLVLVCVKVLKYHKNYKYNYIYHIIVIIIVIPKCANYIIYIYIVLLFIII